MKEKEVVREKKGKGKEMRVEEGDVRKKIMKGRRRNRKHNERRYESKNEGRMSTRIKKVEEKRWTERG